MAGNDLSAGQMGTGLQQGPSPYQVTTKPRQVPGDAQALGQPGTEPGTPFDPTINGNEQPSTQEQQGVKADTDADTGNLEDLQAQAMVEDVLRLNPGMPVTAARQVVAQAQAYLQQDPGADHALRVVSFSQAEEPEPPMGQGEPQPPLRPEEPTARTTDIPVDVSTGDRSKEPYHSFGEDR